MHFTLTSSTSWLNAVEGWFGQLERRSIYRKVFTNVKELMNEIYRFTIHHNSKTANFLVYKKRRCILEKWKEQHNHLTTRLTARDTKGRGFTCTLETD